MRILPWLFALAFTLLTVAVGVSFAWSGIYGVGVLFRHGGTWWLPVGADSRLMSPSMRLALSGPPGAAAGNFQWRGIAPGFETADMPVRASGRIVDHVYLARIDPARYSFVARNMPNGDYGLDQWMAHLGAALVVNGSYYARGGGPDTPVLSDGVLIGPRQYEARAGAFIAAPDHAGIADLSHRDWREAFRGADNAMVSYPLLLADGETRVKVKSNWLANRSFIGQDSDGRILIGTTTDAYFSLDRLAQFLKAAPLGLRAALNLDGGPVASQGIQLNGYTRKTYGRYEAQVKDGKVKLLGWPYGTVAMPIVLAVYPR